MKEFSILKVGSVLNQAGEVIDEITQSDIEKTAANYSTENEIPLVIGHPSLDATAPAYGWVDRFEIRGDELFVIPKDVNPEFSRLVKERTYPKRSIRGYRMPEGGFELMDIGFLGGSKPAIPGLKEVSFTAQAGQFIEVTMDNEELKQMDLTPDQMAAIQDLITAAIAEAMAGMAAKTPEKEEMAAPMADAMSMADLKSAIELMTAADRTMLMEWLTTSMSQPPTPKTEAEQVAYSQMQVMQRQIDEMSRREAASLQAQKAEGYRKRLSEMNQSVMPHQIERWTAALMAVPESVVSYSANGRSAKEQAIDLIFGLLGEVKQIELREFAAGGGSSKTDAAKKLLNRYENGGKK